MERYSAGQAVQTPVAASEVVCAVCSRKLHRGGNKNRHKCLGERKKAVSEQEGAAQYQACNKWFKSRGGLANHNGRHPGSKDPFLNTYKQDLLPFSGACVTVKRQQHNRTGVCGVGVGWVGVVGGQASVFVSVGGCARTCVLDIRIHQCIILLQCPRKALSSMHTMFTRVLCHHFPSYLLPIYHQYLIK